MVVTVLLATCLFQDNSYHGFVRHEFLVDGIQATVVEPKVAAGRREWIWRTEFFDHRPMLDLMMLAKGYHLVYLNVGNTFGAPGPMEEFSKFYSVLVGPEWRLNRRVVLEGFSRGGLYAYNWAARNPDKVQAIYGDAPVCDFKSWPKQHSPDDWKALISSYGFPTEAAANAYPFNPIDNLDAIAAAHIPLIHVVGDADDVVPVSENTAILVQRYLKLGGTIEVIHKPGVNHHPHSLDDPTPIADFLLKHEFDSEKALAAPLIPAPGMESRYSSAGWGDRSWLDQHEDIVREARRQRYNVVLVGDSISQGFGGPGRSVYGSGQHALQEQLPGVLNGGIAGDRVQNVLWRLDHDLVKASKGLYLVLIGINNSRSDSPEAVAAGLRKIRGRLPRGRGKILPILLAGKSANDPQRMWVEAVNRQIRGFSERPFEGFTLANGDLNPELYAGDNLHLSAKGYDLLAKQIAARYLKK